MIDSGLAALLEDTIDLTQSIIEVSCQCSQFHFHGVCEHVNKTMLLVDDIPGEPSRAYFEDHDRCIVLDGIKIHNDRLVKRLPMQIILEDMRRKLVRAMQEGETLVVRCGSKAIDWLTIDDEHCPDLDPQYESHPPYNKLSYVPSIWLLNGGARLRSDAAWARKLMRREDLLRGTATAQCLPRFGILFTTTIPSEDVEARLFDGVIGLPRGQFDVIELGEVFAVEGEGEGVDFEK